jgi:FAD/FMN-containing dehydrogenase
MIRSRQVGKRQSEGFSLEIMKRIKRMFDLNDIMNPGKMGLDEGSI